MSCLPLLDCRCSACHCRHPPSPAEYTSLLLSVHAIRGSALAPTASERRVIAREQHRELIGVLVERLTASATFFCPSSPCVSARSPGRGDDGGCGGPHPLVANPALAHGASDDVGLEACAQKRLGIRPAWRAR